MPNMSIQVNLPMIMRLQTPTTPSYYLYWVLNHWEDRDNNGLHHYAKMA